MDKCYLLQIFEMESSLCKMAEIPASYRSSSLFSDEDEEERERIKRALSLDGEPLVNLGIFVCRSFEKAREIMLDSSFIPADWINCYREDDPEGNHLEIYLSTDRCYLCKIFRTEIY